MLFIELLPMSIIKQEYYEEFFSPSYEDIQEYEIYCYYQDMKKKWLEENNPLEFFQPLMEEE